jgi:hypothetical protein
MRLKEIKEALDYGRQNRRTHDRLFSEARNPQKWAAIKSDPFYQEILQETRDEAATFLQQPLPALPYSLFKLFWETGSRKEFEDLYFGRRARLRDLAILTLAQEDSGFVRSLEDTIWAICDEYTWCLPAHLKDCGDVRDSNESLETKRQGVLSRKLCPSEKIIDLFAAETAFALAEILSLLEERLDPKVVERGRAEVFRRVLEPYQKLNPLLWWETCSMNWAGVCAGSIGAAAMYLIEDEAVLAPLLQRVLATLESYLDGFGADGSTTEGLFYWDYGFGFFVYFASLLSERTAGKLDLLRQERFETIALFQQKCYLAENYIVNFSDAPLTQDYQVGLTHFLKRIFPKLEIPENCYRGRFIDDFRGRWATAVRDLVWANPDLKPDLQREGTEYFPDAQWLIAKHLYQGKLVGFAAKGGHNDEPHNHNDIGSFLLHVNGETLLTDLGRGEYTRQYFHEERYEFLCNSSRGHSVPIIGGEYQKAGLNFAASQVAAEMSPCADILRLELAGAYDFPNLQSLMRCFVFKKEKAPQLILTDRFLFTQSSPSVTERLVSRYRPEQIVPGRIRVAGMNYGVEIVFDPECLQFRLRREQMISFESKPQDVYLIDLETTPGHNEFAIEIIFNLIWEHHHETN